MREFSRNIQEGLVTLEIPRQYLELRDQIAALTLPLAQRIESQRPNDRFGLRVHQHSLRLSNEAAYFAEKEGYSPDDAGALMVALFCEDIGRHIAALPFEERINYQPKGTSDEDWRDDNKAQHRHGELSVEYLKRHDLLNSLAPAQRQLVIDAVYQHSLQNIQLPQGHLSYQISCLARDIDRIDLLLRSEFTEGKGALEQFIKWGCPKLCATGEELLEVFSPSDTLRSDTIQMLDSLFAGNRDQYNFKKMTLRNEVAHSQTKSNIVAQLIEWFETKPRGEFLIRLDQLADPTLVKSPSLSKDEMIENYPSYMLAHLLIPLQISSKSVIEFLKDRSHLTARFQFLEFTLGEGEYTRYIRILERRLGY